MRRIVVKEFEIGDQRGSSVQTLKQIVAQQQILGNSIGESGLECVNVVQALARIDPFSEQVLVDV